MHKDPRRILGWMLVLALVLGATATAAAQTIFVSPSGSDDGGDGSASAPYQSIAHALAVAPVGATVTLEPGVYRTSVSITKRVTLTSDPTRPASVASTVIDASGEVNGIVVAGPGTRGTVVAGLTVKNALKAGILVLQTSRVTVQGNVVTANDQSCAGFRGCFNPKASLPVPQGSFTYTNDVPCGNPDFAKNPGQDCEALHLVSVTDSLVLGNTVQGNLDGGIYLTDEAGPNSGNLVEGNVVEDNLTDCGITLASHNPKAVADPGAGGVFHNTVRHNAAIGNGGAGILMAGPMPGAASYENTVSANMVEANGMPGIVVHAHTPGQNMNGNVITDNFVSGNGAGIGDPDAGLTPEQTTGIDIFSKAGPLTGTRVQGNTVADQHFGVWLGSLVQQPAVSGNAAVGQHVDELVVVAPPAAN